ncbi:hypothetical protein JQK88_10315 [Mesorhizobium caraganae]|uniref:hypothetical protein n=1 Tax=Mesorhizobium caraganae TaxID=483206 RepID=UPI001939E22E|nr:hypothetical protein [Mesorhizobium caraganae]MBM2711640.1 hypothetical protein [Mesorhizobium caraganae]
MPFNRRCGGDLAGVFPEFVKHLPEADCSKFLFRTERKVTSDTGVVADVVVVVEDPPGYRESRGLPPL